jgi:lambda repressor-like predicted transcriptional regulator
MTSDPLYQKNLELIEDRLVQYGPRKNLAREVGVSDSQLSKLLNGDLRQYARILAALKLEIAPQEYLKALKTIVQKEIRP